MSIKKLFGDKPKNKAKTKSTSRKTTPKKAPTKKTTLPQKTYAAIGAEGEQQIYNVLVQLFGVNAVFKNVYVRRPSGRLTEIDLLAVHPTGVYVVESKNYSGMVLGDGGSDEWTHTKSATFKRAFYSPVFQNRGHIDALKVACQSHLGIVPSMLSLLVFPDRCELQITNLPAGLRCCRLLQLPEVLSGVVTAVRPVLTQSQVQTLAALFYQSQRHLLPPEIQAQHMKDVLAARRWAKNS